MTWRSSILVPVMGILAAISTLPAAASTSGVVISQVYGGGGNSGAPYQNDYIELLNAGSSTVDIGGWSVQYASSSGTTWNNTTDIPASTTLQPGQYYLIAEGSGGSNGVALPTPDLSGSISMSGSKGKVALVSGSTSLSGACPLADASVVDLVGYGSADCSEGAGTAPTLNNTTAALRADAGCTDSNDNSNDFSAAAPNPRNTATALNPCGGSGGVTLSIDNVSQPEGDSGTTTFTFVVSLTNPAPAGGVTFDIATADGTATTADNDYVANSVTGATIAEGDSSYDFDVTVNGDTTPEPDETFSVNVTNITGATNTSASATGTIENDDIANVEIFDIQGTGDASPYVGQRVHTHNNIVTAVGSAGFYMQTPDVRDDGNMLTSNGVYVYTGGAPTVSAGDDVSLDADVDEFYNLTELKNISNLTINSSGNALPAAIALDAAIPSPDPNALSCGSTNFECMEGMRVSIANGIVTRANQSFSSDHYAEVFISTSGKRSLREPGLNYGLAPTPGDNDAAGVWDGNPEIFEMDADAFLPPQPPSGAINGGSTFSGEGVISYNFGDYQFLPTTLALTYNAPMPRPVADVADSNILRVGDFNVERFCDDVDDVAGGSETYECAGNSVPSAGDYQLKTARLSDYIGNVLKLPDVIALQEVENISVLQTLANRIDSDFGVTYTPQLIEGHDPSGIDVGYLVNTARIQITDVHQLAATETWNDPNTGPGSFIHDHPPLLFKGVFLGDGSVSEPFMLITVHMKSRGKVDDGGPASDRDREKRLRQAYSLAEQVQQLQTNPINAGIPLTVLGDFNDYEFSDGFVDITGMVSGRYDFAANLWDLSDIGQPDQNVVNPKLWDAVYSLPDNERYSYLYTENFGNIQGFSPRKLPTNQVLDHALLSDAARAGFISMQYGRADEDAADEDENTSTSAIGVSDHDGFVVRMSFDRIFADGFEMRD